jgi:hypothetical protein
VTPESTAKALAALVRDTKSLDVCLNQLLRNATSNRLNLGIVLAWVSTWWAQRETSLAHEVMQEDESKFEPVNPTVIEDPERN